MAKGLIEVHQSSSTGPTHDTVLVFKNAVLMSTMQVQLRTTHEPKEQLKSLKA